MKSVTKTVWVVLPDGRKVRRCTTVRNERGGYLHIDNLIMPISFLPEQISYEEDVLE